MSMREPNFRQVEPGGFIVYGPCPECGNWQLEVPDTLMGMFDMIEEALTEHYLTEHPKALGEILRKRQASQYRAKEQTR